MSVRGKTPGFDLISYALKSKNVFESALMEIVSVLERSNLITCNSKQNFLHD